MAEAELQKSNIAAGQPAAAGESRPSVDSCPMQIT